jgi:hypoxanthine phosphoribosyltransferase
MTKEHAVLYTAEEFQSEVERLAVRIDSNNVDSYVVVTVLKGTAIFSSDLVRAMRTETELVYISASSYLRDFTPSESLTVNNDQPQ